MLTFLGQAFHGACPKMHFPSKCGRFTDIKNRPKAHASRKRNGFRFLETVRERTMPGASPLGGKGIRRTDDFAFSDKLLKAKNGPVNAWLLGMILYSAKERVLNNLRHLMEAGKEPGAS
ncbi:MAG: hypothetical protein WHS46_13195 [Desulfosoma sp.]